jgi:tetratricopeptide (TPR) repeat protein
LLFPFLPRANKEFYLVKLGDAFIDLHLHSLACRYFEQALKIQDRAWSHMQLGFALSHLGHYDQALLHYRKAYSLWPSPIFAAEVARLENRCGNRKEAADLVEAALGQPDLLDEEALRRLKELEAELANDRGV